MSNDFESGALVSRSIDNKLGDAVSTTEASNRLSRLYVIAYWALAVLFAKVLLAILWEYRWYFPANFDASAFLSGRRYTFIGLYRAAFYAHILCGPVAVLLGVFLMLTGGRSHYRGMHRTAGRVLMLLMFSVLLPSGFVMARQAYSGPIAAWGFAALSAATGTCGAAAWLLVRARKFRSHRVWATRCFILLASPLLLRVIAGAVIVLDLESDLSYRLNAWLSWLLPLAVYEVWRWRGAGGSVIVTSRSLPRSESPL